VGVDTNSYLLTPTRLGSLLWILGLLVLFTFPPLAMGEESVLTFQQSGLEEERIPWPLESTLLGQSDRHAVMKLDGEKQEDVFVIQSMASSSTQNFFISQSKPYRLYIDLNNDGKCQDHEITTAQRMDDPFPLPKYEFKNVKFPFFCYEQNMTIEIDAEMYFLSDRVTLQFSRITSFYAGDILVGNKKYPARMIFRSINPIHNYVNEIIIVDSNRDGAFHPFQDQWFSSHGVGYFDDSLLSVTTEFTETKAKVQITPYKGKTGTFIIDANNIHRLYLQRADNLTSLLCLPKNQTKQYILPVGNYSYHKVWLDTEKDDLFFELIQKSRIAFRPDRGRSSSAIIVTPNREMHFANVGGRLKQSFSARSTHISSIVQLNYNGHEDASGDKYVITHINNIGKDQRPPAPKWEIRNANNQVIKTGQFEYG
jgi:hypothetical protein